MNHQCWFFGRDIWHSSGNLLIKYGFERFAVPKGESGGNSYRIKLDRETEVVVWGFGIFLGQKGKGGIFIGRFNCNPRYLSTPTLRLPISKSEYLPNNHPPRNDRENIIVFELAVRLFDWIDNYETWVVTQCGSDWREECIQEWNKSDLPAAEVRNELTQFVSRLSKLSPMHLG